MIKKETKVIYQNKYDYTDIIIPFGGIYSEETAYGQRVGGAPKVALAVSVSDTDKFNDQLSDAQYKKVEKICKKFLRPLGLYLDTRGLFKDFTDFTKQAEKRQSPYLEYTSAHIYEEKQIADNPDDSSTVQNEEACKPYLITPKDPLVYPEED